MDFSLVWTKKNPLGRVNRGYGALLRDSLDGLSASRRRVWRSDFRGRVAWRHAGGALNQRALASCRVQQVAAAQSIVLIVHTVSSIARYFTL